MAAPVALPPGEPAILDAIRHEAHPLTGDRRDYDALLALVGDARIVLLGEASHGTHEFYRARARVTKRLIAERGFTAVAIEGGPQGRLLRPGPRQPGRLDAGGHRVSRRAGPRRCAARAGATRVPGPVRRRQRRLRPRRSRRRQRAPPVCPRSCCARSPPAPAATPWPSHAWSARSASSTGPGPSARATTSPPAPRAGSMPSCTSTAPAPSSRSSARADRSAASHPRPTRPPSEDDAGRRPERALGKPVCVPSIGHTRTDAAGRAALRQWLRKSTISRGGAVSVVTRKSVRSRSPATQVSTPSKPPARASSTTSGVPGRRRSGPV